MGRPVNQVRGPLGQVGVCYSQPLPEAGDITKERTDLYNNIHIDGTKDRFPFNKAQVVQSLALTAFTTASISLNL